MSSEQWKNGGNCKYCRREKYCQKPCKECTVRLNREVFTEIDMATSGVISKMLVL